MNDSTVTIVSPQHVLRQQAYILFYSKVQPAIPGSESTNGMHMKNSKNGKVGNETSITDSVPLEGSNKSSKNGKDDNLKSNSDSYIDDLGESLSPQELADRAKKQLELTIKRNSTNQQSDEMMKNGLIEDNAIDSEVENISHFLGEEIETRLVKIKSWAVKPFR